MIRGVVIVSLILCACSDKNIQTRVQSADRIEVVDNDTKFSYEDARPEIVDGFKQVLSTEPAPTKCTPQGRVKFKKGNEVLANVGYYKDASSCTFLIEETGSGKIGYHLSPNTLMYLGVYFQNLKMEHEARHH